MKRLISKRYNNSINDELDLLDADIFSSNKEQKTNKSFLEENVSNNQLTPQGRNLLKKVEPVVQQWIQSNFMKKYIPPLIIDEYKQNEIFSFIKQIINDNYLEILDKARLSGYNSQLAVDFKIYLNLVIDNILLKYEKNIKKAVVKDVSNKKSFIKTVVNNDQYTEIGLKQKEQLITALSKWYKSNFDNFKDQVNKQFDLKNFLLQSFQNNKDYLYQSLKLDPSKYNSWLNNDIDTFMSKVLDDVMLINYSLLFPSQDLSKSVDYHQYEYYYQFLD